MQTKNSNDRNPLKYLYCILTFCECANADAAAKRPMVASCAAERAAAASRESLQRVPSGATSGLRGTGCESRSREAVNRSTVLTSNGDVLACDEIS